MVRMEVEIRAQMWCAITIIPHAPGASQMPNRDWWRGEGVNVSKKGVRINSNSFRLVMYERPFLICGRPPFPLS